MSDFYSNPLGVNILTKKPYSGAKPTHLFLIVLLFLWVSRGAVAEPDEVLLECSASATDERGIDACLNVLLEQAETRLANVEQSWRKLLGTEASRLQTAESQDIDVAGIDQPDSDQSTTVGSKVIAIVNDSALASGEIERGGEIFNVDDNGEQTETLVNTSVDITERFGFIPALFRTYRDQHCAWQATVFGGDRVDMHYKACLTDQNRTRALELSRSLAEIRSTVKSGLNMRGFYVKTNSGATFQACDRKVDWWVTGSDAVLASLERRYADADTRDVATASGNLIYTELRATLDAAPESGPGADYTNVVRVEKINIFRPSTPIDCVALQQTSIQSEAPVVNLQSAATVDDYASAGFLYGYFNYWLSACSVTENSVCSAESEALFASDGDWKLRVDRSLEGDWRVQLIATSDDEVIEKDLKLMIDGRDVFLPTSFPEPLHLSLQNGVDIARGDIARELTDRMRGGSETHFVWRDESGVLSELKFSLAGVTLALEFFDQSFP